MSTFGTIFQVTTFGESHCAGVGCIVQGVPPRMKLNESDIQGQLDRRKPGQSKLTTPRSEKDLVKILSGTEANLTLGTPICLFVPNQDHKPEDYGDMIDIPRPSHADYTYQKKYGIRAASGGGRSSARETIGRVNFTSNRMKQVIIDTILSFQVAAGAIAEKWLSETYGIEIIAYVSGIGRIQIPTEIDTVLKQSVLHRTQIDQSLVRCPDEKIAESMIREIEAALDDQDSVGGIITCICRNIPAGIGEPVFDKLEAMLAHAMLSIPATKGNSISRVSLET
jgi:chorismate synthase